MQEFNSETIKKRKVESEKTNLHRLAQKSYETLGRLSSKESDYDLRTPFMKDRDRIIHSASFRRLKDKAQVFLLAKNDMVRTRLSHTLEVSQVSRTIANILALNEDLVEAIALGHDLGHTPFGHIGETALSELSKEWFKDDGIPLENGDFLDNNLWLTQSFLTFRHNVQSLRVVDLLENKGQGLNLTYEVRDGIIKHSKWGKGLLDHNQKFLPKTLEGQVVRLADRIAYVNHDLQDAERMGFLNIKEVPQSLLNILGDTHSQRINTAVIDVISQFQKTQTITMTKPIAKAIDDLYEFLFTKVYRDSHIHIESQKALYIIKELASYYKKYPDVILNLTKDLSYPEGTKIEHKIIDYIANMTDHYILHEFQKHLLPSGDI